MTEEIQLVNENGTIVGRDADTGDKIPISIESLETGSATISDKITWPDGSSTTTSPGGKGVTTTPGWQPTKNATNPIFDGTSGEATRSYVPSVVQPNSTYYAVVKSNNDIYGFSSSDGVTWTEEGVVVSNQYAPLLLYDPNSSTYHLYTSDQDDKNVNHYTSINPVSGYSADSSNPIYTASDIDADIGQSEYTDVLLGDIVHYDGQYIFYMWAINNNDYRDPTPMIFYGIGNDLGTINGQQQLFSGNDVSYNGSYVSNPTVIKSNGAWVMCFTAGKAGVSELGERKLFTAVGGPYDFQPVAGRVLDVGASGTWEDRRVYAANWLKMQDGEYLTPKKVNGNVRLYYSGHANDGSNGGYGGLATFPEVASAAAMRPITYDSEDLVDPSDPVEVSSTNLTNISRGNRVSGPYKAFQMVGIGRHSTSGETISVALTTQQSSGTTVRSALAETASDPTVDGYHRFETPVVRFNAEEPQRYQLQSKVSTDNSGSGAIQSLFNVKIRLYKALNEPEP